MSRVGRKYRTGVHDGTPVGPGPGEMGLSGSLRAGDEKGLTLVDPLSARRPKHDRAVQVEPSCTSTQEALSVPNHTESTTPSIDPTDSNFFGLAVARHLSDAKSSREHSPTPQDHWYDIADDAAKAPWPGDGACVSLRMHARHEDIVRYV